ncbi:MAG TPA: iron-sulfur cluster assembly scaffold protein [Candidatus Rifleibacterium sp.]|nr:iron-sulfur cluster assembly scaffold protein [Candidatus Rifleibacterium sp.]HPT48409.1 iron-sulfur cluster assembly scaffold protein [Candidatus Rifleibacterium sp.]
MNYSAKVLQHFHNPGKTGHLDDYHGIGQIGDPDCGDFVEMTIHVSEDNQKVEKVRYRIKGCPAAIATSSITAEIAEGMQIEDALKITDQQIVEALDGLPESKVHCSLLAVRALQLAIQDAILKRLFKKAGIVSTDEEFEKLKAEGRLNEYLGLPSNEISHDCDGSCETIGKKCV